MTVPETVVCNRQHKHESERKSSDRHEECIISKPEIAHKPSLLGPFEELYGKVKPVSVGRPCDVCGKDCKIKGLGGLPLCCGNLQKKVNIDEPGVCNRKHKHEFERKSYGRAFKCDGCKEQGSGLRYRCDGCGYELHEECIFPQTEISHEGSLLRFFEEPQPVYVKGKRVSEGRPCDTCGKDIRGFNYHCKIKGWDIHPCCSNPQKKLCIDKTGVYNRKHKHEFERKSYDRAFKCGGCKEQGSGLRYRCDRCGYELHEECIFPQTEISHEGSLLRFFEEPQPVYVKGKRVSEGRPCDTCGKDIRGFNYHCKIKGWDIHPCCSNPQKKLCIDKTSVYNRKHKFKKESCDRSAFKCDGCKKQGFGSRYRCDCCGYELHKECFSPNPEISLEGFLFRFFEEPQPVYVKGEWVSKERCCDACGKDIRGFNYHCKTKGWDIHPCCRNLQLATSRTEGRKGKFWWMLELFLNTVRAILGDPTAIISQVVIALLTSSQRSQGQK